MCRLCRLGADLDVLVSIWSLLSLRLKRRQLTRLCRCAHLRQSLQSPATYQLDEVHVRTVIQNADDLPTSLMAVRLPPYLSGLRTLACTLTRESSERSTFPQFDGHSAVHTPNTSSRLRQIRRIQRTSIGLDGVTQLRVLVLRDLSCLICECKLAEAKTFRNNITFPFPRLPRLRVLVCAGHVNNHCLTWLLSVRTQCPELLFVDLQRLTVDSLTNNPPDAPAHAAQLVEFLSWITTANHTLMLDGDMKRSCTPLLQQPVPRAADERLVEYVDLAHLIDDRDDWQMITLLSPFRQLSPSGELPASASSALSSIRVLDMRFLEATDPIVVDQLCTLPPLPALRLVVMPDCDDGDEQWWDNWDDDECMLFVDGMFHWLSSCPQLTHCDNLTLHALWIDTCTLLLDSELPSRLTSLELHDAARESDSVLDAEDCLVRCFPPVAPCPFIALQHVALPLGISESGRLDLSLANLRHLPALHSVWLMLRIIPQTAAEDEESDEEAGEQKADVEAESAFSQLSVLAGLRWLALVGAWYPFDYMGEDISEATAMAVISALFGRPLPLLRPPPPLLRPPRYSVSKLSSST